MGLSYSTTMAPVWRDTGLSWKAAADIARAIWANSTSVNGAVATCCLILELRTVHGQKALLVASATSERKFAAALLLLEWHEWSWRVRDVPAS